MAVFRRNVLLYENVHRIGNDDIFKLKAYIHEN